MSSRVSAAVRVRANPTMLWKAPRRASSLSLVEWSPVVPRCVALAATIVICYAVGTMELPSLTHDYNGALIEAVTVGPRRELTLNVAILSWYGSSGRHDLRIQIRFGGVTNLEQAAEFFRLSTPQKSELAYLRYSAVKASKPGHLFIEVAMERIEAAICVSCANVSIRPASADRAVE